VAVKTERERQADRQRQKDRDIERERKKERKKERGPVASGFFASQGGKSRS